MPGVACSSPGRDQVFFKQDYKNVALRWGRPTECHPEGINVPLRFASGDIDSLGVTFGGSPPMEGNIFIILFKKNMVPTGA